MFKKKQESVVTQQIYDYEVRKRDEEKKRADKLQKFLTDITVLEPSLARFRVEWEDGWGNKEYEWSFDDVHDFVVSNAASERYAELKARFETKERK